MQKNQEAIEKLKLIRNLLKERSEQALLITEQPSFSWITGGGRGFLGLASTRVCASLLITEEKVYLLANNIEADRLMEEEGLGSFCELLASPWQQDGGLLEMARTRLSINPVPEIQWKKELDACRQLMSEQESHRYLALCRKAAQSLEETMREFSPGISEFEAAGRISAALWSEGIEPISLFVAADDRVQCYRHFIPTEKTADHQIIASICGRKGGLVASVTRTVAFDGNTEVLESYYNKLLSIQAAGWDSLNVGRPLCEVYSAICDAYSKNGLDQEWNNHHQGGLTGYMPREIRIDNETKTLIRESQAFAFNPSCKYAKVEDTVLFSKGKVQIMSAPTGQWPTVEAGGYLQPYILKK